MRRETRLGTATSSQPTAGAAPAGRTTRSLRRLLQTRSRRQQQGGRRRGPCASVGIGRHWPLRSPAEAPAPSGRNAPKKLLIK